MTTSYHPFRPAHALTEHLSDPAMPPHGYDAVAASKVSGQPPEFVVQGEWRRDNRRFLDLALSRDYIEAVSNYRDLDGTLRWTCPECGRLSGKHTRVCGYEG